MGTNHRKACKHTNLTGSVGTSLESPRKKTSRLGGTERIVEHGDGDALQGLAGPYSEIYKFPTLVFTLAAGRYSIPGNPQPTAARVIPLKTAKISGPAFAGLPFMVVEIVQYYQAGGHSASCSGIAIAAFITAIRITDRHSISSKPCVINDLISGWAHFLGNRRNITIALVQNNGKGMLDGRERNRIANYTKFWNKDISKEDETHVDSYADVVNGPSV
ncbi:hypothetical protein DFH07DRAFT_1036953 [Mycena maculata]|uniref:Uncharacterized protein n=1 Tax=Mycena maculata TaxID=230809 RepID=A0AAD7IQT1_9AGAR|nr:hypothetical protein DFH07DRAFT_1036953 [Mycena maculata]